MPHGNLRIPAAVTGVLVPRHSLLQPELEKIDCSPILISIMALLVLPLSSRPPGYGLSDRAMSAVSTTTAFQTGLDQRDRFLGWSCCVICGESSIGTSEHCHIIMDSEPHTVSRNSMSFPKANVRDSGLTSKTVVGSLGRPKGYPARTARWHDDV